MTPLSTWGWSREISGMTMVSLSRDGLGVLLPQKRKKLATASTRAVQVCDGRVGVEPNELVVA
jgi:hypothetical protein